MIFILMYYPRFTLQ